ncbi:MAG: BlaI/MecI/CopY family transcriptional regulator [Pirellulales bacterium]
MATRIRLTDAEFAVLEPLWHIGPQTIRQLTARLYPDQSTSDYATVQKLLERLEAKRCVTRDRTGLAHVFRAAVRREDLIDQQLHEIADRLCDGSLVPVLNQLMRRVSLSRAEREELRKLLDAHKRRSTGER